MFNFYRFQIFCDWYYRGDFGEYDVISSLFGSKKQIFNMEEEKGLRKFLIKFNVFIKKGITVPIEVIPFIKDVDKYYKERIIIS